MVAGASPALRPCSPPAQHPAKGLLVTLLCHCERNNRKQNQQTFCKAEAGGICTFCGFRVALNARERSQTRDKGGAEGAAARPAAAKGELKTTLDCRLTAADVSPPPLELRHIVTLATWTSYLEPGADSVCAQSAGRR